MRLYTIKEVASLLGVSTLMVRWLILTGKLKISERKGFRCYIEGRNIARYVYDHPEYDGVIRDRLGWDISDYRRMRATANKLGILESRVW